MPANTEEKLHDIWINAQGFGIQFRVVWNKPEKVHEFKFPMIEITVTSINWQTDEKETVRQFTQPHSTYEALMEELIGVALHPSMRDMVNRAIFEQWYGILNRNHDYEIAVAKFKKVASKAKQIEAGLDTGKVKSKKVAKKKAPKMKFAKPGEMPPTDPNDPNFRIAK